LELLLRKPQHEGAKILIPLQPSSHHQKGKADAMYIYKGQQEAITKLVKGLGRSHVVVNASKRNEGAGYLIVNLDANIQIEINSSGKVTNVFLNYRAAPNLMNAYQKVEDMKVALEKIGKALGENYLPTM
jgi:hypothetical protein